MKSKIDELKKVIARIKEIYPPIESECVLELVEQLLPYAEFYDNLELRGITVKWQEYRIEREIADNIIKQIKEQNDETKI